MPLVIGVSAGWTVGLIVGVVVVIVAAAIVITIVLLAMRIAKQAHTAVGGVAKVSEQTDALVGVGRPARTERRTPEQQLLGWLERRLLRRFVLRRRNGVGGGNLGPLVSHAGIKRRDDRGHQHRQSPL